MRLKELPDAQSGFFKINYNNFSAKEYCMAVEDILEAVELLCLNKYNERISKLQILIADSNSYIVDKVKKINTFLDKLRLSAEKKQYYELCYNISQVCAILAHALNMYKEIDIT